jgi:bacterioferritin-associated ferredoxin
MYACICRGITEADVRRVGRAGVTAPDRLIAVLGLDDERCCGRCALQVGAFVELAWEGASHASLQAGALIGGCQARDAAL